MRRRRKNQPTSSEPLQAPSSSPHIVIIFRSEHGVVGELAKGGREEVLARVGDTTGFVRQEDLCSNTWIVALQIKINKEALFTDLNLKHTHFTPR
jgi:hypothetical protein